MCVEQSIQKVVAMNLLHMEPAAGKKAHLCRLDMVPESFVVDKPARDLRELTRTRLGLQQDTVSPRNHIHAIIAKYSHKRPAGELFTGRGLEWLQNVPLRETDRMAVQAHLGYPGHPVRAYGQIREEDSGDRNERQAGASDHDHSRDMIHN